MLYRFLWVVLRLFINLPFRVRFIGRERVPRAGGVMLAANHESYMDPVVLALGLPRVVHFMARADLWRFRVFGWLLTSLHSFPVHRGSADRQAIASAGKLLESGEQVGIFPQGTRHHAPGLAGLEEGAGGAALIALRAGTPVVPVGILGTERIVPRGSRFIRFPRLIVAYGPPIHPADIPEGARRERVEEMTKRIMDGIRDAMAEAAASQERGG